VENMNLLQFTSIKRRFSNDILLGFIQVDIETPERRKEYFSEVVPYLKDAAFNFTDIADYMQIPILRIMLDLKRDIIDCLIICKRVFIIFSLQKGRVRGESPLLQHSPAT
jgi:hypothetical protein